MRKGTKLSRLRLLCDEGSAIPIHFETELRPLKAAIAAANQWADTYKAQLAALGLSPEEDADPSLHQGPALDDAGAVETEDGSPAERKRKLPPNAPDAVVEGEPVPPSRSDAAVSYAELGEMVAAAAQLVAEFDLTR